MCLSKKLSKFFIERSGYSEYQIQKNDSFCASYCLYILYLTKVLGVILNPLLLNFIIKDFFKTCIHTLIIITESCYIIQTGIIKIILLFVFEWVYLYNITYLLKVFDTNIKHGYIQLSEFLYLCILTII